MCDEYQSLSPEERQKIQNVSRQFTRVRSVEELREMLVQNENGQVLQRFENYVNALACNPLLYDAIRLNTMTERVEIVKPVGWERKAPAFTDTDLRYIRLYKEIPVTHSRDGGSRMNCCPDFYDAQGRERNFGSFAARAPRRRIGEKCVPLSE